MTLKLDPAERFLLLAQLLDDVVAPTPDTVRAVTLASMTVLRQVQGRATVAEALFAVDRARGALHDASLPLAGTAAPASASPPAPRARRVCVVLSVDVDRFSDAYLRKHYRGVLRIGGRIVEVPGELRRLCADFRARGLEAFPCEHANERGLCQGWEAAS